MFQSHQQIVWYPHPLPISAHPTPKPSNPVRVISKTSSLSSITSPKISSSVSAKLSSFKKPSKKVIRNTNKIVKVTSSHKAPKSDSFVTPQSTFSSYSPIHENGVSGPNPGDFPIISLIDEPTVNYYDQILQNIEQAKDSSNPYYAPEEFNYNQDPIQIDHTESEINLINDIGDDFSNTFTLFDDANTFETKAPDVVTTIMPKAETTTDTESTLIVTTEESTEESTEVEELPSIHNIYDNVIPSLGSLVDCGAGSEKRFCSMGSSYPKEKIKDAVENCTDIIEAFRAVIPEDFDALGDNSINVISSEKDLTRPWSWKVYAYKKRQICDSELSFTRPSYALDTEGHWRVILQTDQILQRVSLDTCTKPGYPCPGVLGCGRKSSCVQRFSHQFLLSLPSSISSTTSSTHSCPSIRAFKFPSGCVCHAEAESDKDIASDTESLI